MLVPIIIFAFTCAFASAMPTQKKALHNAAKYEPLDYDDVSEFEKT